MKRLIIFLSLISSLAYGQVNNTTNTNFTNGLGASKFFNIPRGTVQPTTGILVGSLFYHTTLGLQYYDGASWQTVGVSGAGVTSFNGRTGVVVPLTGDYAAFYVPYTGANSNVDLGLHNLAIGPVAAPSEWSGEIGVITSASTTAKQAMYGLNTSAFGDGVIGEATQGGSGVVGVALTGFAGVTGWSNSGFGGEFESNTNIALKASSDSGVVLEIKGISGTADIFQAKNALLGPEVIVSRITRAGVLSANSIYNIDPATSGDKGNTAYGFEAGQAITGTAYWSTAIGHKALRADTSPDENTAVGYESMTLMNGGYFNTGVGSRTLRSATTAYENTAIGGDALFSTTNGYKNIAIGYAAGYSLTTGHNNIIIGTEAATGMTTGSGNIILSATQNLPGAALTNNIIFRNGAGTNAAVFDATNWTLSGSTTSTSFIKTGGTSSQFLKADGSVDSNTYLTASTGVTSITGTANEIDVSASTGAVTLSLPATINANTTGNAATVTDGVYTTGNQTIAGIKTFQNANIPYGPIRIIQTGDNTGEASINYKRSSQSNDEGWTVGQGVLGIADNFGWYLGGSNRMTLSTGGALTATSLIKSGGTSSQFLKADGSVDANTYEAVLTFTSPLSRTSNTISIPAATNSINGYLTTTDLNSFNNNESTGIISFTGLSIAGTTTFNVGAIKGWIINNETDPTLPTKQYVNYAGTSNVTGTYVLTNTTTYILLTPSLTILQQTTPPTPLQRRQNIFLGQLGHANMTSIIQVFNSPDINTSPASQLRDIFKPIHLINDGVATSPNGANLSFNTSSGTLYGLGIGLIADITMPNSLAITAQAPTTFQYRTQNGGTASNVTVVDPTMYDVAGTVTAISGGNNQSTNQRIYLTQTGIIRTQYGQTVYSSLTNAVTAAQTESFITFSNFKENAILIGILSVRKGASDLSVSTDAVFVPVSKFGETTGGSNGLSTTTLQQAYNNSASPEITTTTAIGSVDIKRGSAADSDNVLRILNGAGTGTVGVTGAGDVTATSFTGLATGLTGTASALNIGGNAATATLAANSTLWNGSIGDLAIAATDPASVAVYDNIASAWRYQTVNNFKTTLGLGTNAYTSTAYLPLAGGIVTGATQVNVSGLALLSIANGGASANYFRASTQYFQDYSGADALTLSTASALFAGRGNFGTSLRVQGASAPSSGSGLEFQYDGEGYVLAYDRTAATYKPLHLEGSSIILNAPVTGTSLSMSGSGTFGGALTGTSAKLLSGSSTPALIIGDAGGAGSTNQATLQFGDANANYKIQAGDDYTGMNFKVGGTDRLSISNTGPATFSSTVTVATPTAGGHATTKTYVDDADALKANIASPTFTGNVTVTGSANNRVTNNKILYQNTTDAATAVELTTDGAAGSGTSNRIVVPNNTTMSCVVNIAVKQTGSANSKQMLRQFLITNNGGTTTIEGTVTTLGTDVGSVGLATVSCTITANDTNDAIKVEVNGVAATNLRYTCYIVSTETLY